MELNDEDYIRFRDLIKEKTGLHFPEKKRSELATRIGKALADSPCADLDEYYDYLTSHPSRKPALDDLVAHLTIGETYFFRNKAHFEALEKQILPGIIAERSRSTRHIRIWSVGCSTGEEPYSVAILLHKLLPDRSTWNILLLATDINRESLEKARAGVYRSWSFRDVPTSVQETYFTRQENEYHLHEEIREMVTFDYLNLVEGAYPSTLTNTNAMDLILCRNVTIYFDQQVTQRIAGKLYQCLVDGGWLIVGHAEPLAASYSQFETVSFPGTVIYRKPGRRSTAESNGQMTETNPRSCNNHRTSTMAYRLSYVDHQPSATASEPSTVDHQPPDLSHQLSTLGDPGAETPYEAGLRLLHEGNLERALARFQEKLEQDPEYAPTYVMMSHVYANQGDLQQAQYWCEKAIEKDRLLPEAYYTLSLIYQEREQEAAAVDALKKAIFLNPHFVMAHFSLASLYRKAGDNGKSRKHLENVLQLLQNRPPDEVIPHSEGTTVGRLLHLLSGMPDA